LKGAGDLKRNYGFEYIGDNFDLFISPETDKGLVNLFRCISQPLKLWKAVHINGEYPIRADFAIRQLADICGEPLIKTSSMSTEQYK
jgi:hypothetical protein